MPDSVLKLLWFIYGLNQAAMAFCHELLKYMKSMNMKQSSANTCLYHNWTDNGLVLMASWIDDNLIVGLDVAVSEAKQKLMGRFNSKDCGKLEEYVGCKTT